MSCRHPCVWALLLHGVVNPRVLTTSGSKAAIGPIRVSPETHATKRLSTMSTDRNPGFGRRLFLRMTTALCAAAGLPGLAQAADSVGAVIKLRGQARAARG